MVAGAASLEEVDRYYDLLELLDLNDALDVQEEANAKALGGK